MLRYILLLLFVTALKPSHAQYFDTLHIHYDIGVAGLAKKDKALLDSVAGQAGSRSMLIYSYADYLGSEKPNQHLSDNRALEVKQYLVRKGIPPEQIRECTGLGRIAGSGGAEGNPIYRRTDVFIRKEKPTIATNKPPVENSFPQKPPVENVVVPDSNKAPQNITQFRVEDLKVLDKIRMKNILFFPGSPEMLPGSEPELNNLYITLRDHPKMRIKVEGHVCCSAYPEGYVKTTRTWALSVERARTVYQYLIDRGIAADRLEYEGFGRTQPIRENETNYEEGQVNRRVEIRILDM